MSNFDKFLRTLKKIITFPFKAIALFFIYCYKYIISPALPHTCRFIPSCSTYMLLAIREFGVIKGIYLGTKRICRCLPNGKSGLDLLPLNIKGDIKWLI